ncbi:hypothetical protein BS47DRAFT_1171749 [Hydnum rufescens UP504]|uniref:Uncharacterized protein n=1 Tax=Hydnum rufescens UP504 TaxID=1448309 RepID=A0A9P6AT23_9AGAM|nr:hypothetical protein BS47DRAFT_1171749 [Hydnum rufescens UP504]
MDIIQAMGNILTVRWAFNGKVTEGSYCTAQAVLQQIGDVGVCASWIRTFVGHKHFGLRTSCVAEVQTSGKLHVVPMLYIIKGLALEQARRAGRGRGRPQMGM